MLCYLVRNLDWRWQSERAGTGLYAQRPRTKGSGSVDKPAETGDTWQHMGSPSLFVGLEALTAVTMKRTVSSDMTPCSQVEVYVSFGGTYILHLQGRRVG
jgi:hypothetical protein